MGIKKADWNKYSIKFLPSFGSRDMVFRPLCAVGQDIGMLFAAL